eukprot:RCo038031
MSVYCPKTADVKWDVVMDIDVDAVFEGKAKLNRELLAHIIQSRVSSSQPEATDPVHITHLFRVTQALLETTLFENGRFSHRLQQQEQQLKASLEELQKLKTENAKLKGEVPGILPAEGPAKAEPATASSSEEVKLLQDKLKKMQEQYSAVVKQKSALADELQSLKEQSSSSVKDAGLEAELEKLKLELQEKAKETEALGRSMEGKLSESTQFKNLKAMLGQKNEAIKELRQKLRKYEPDCCPSADD